MFIKEALAEPLTAVADTAAGGESILTSMLPLFIILAIFYFIVIRPQNKRMHEHRAMINDLKKGDKIVTGGGLIGKVKKTVGDDELVVELADGFDVNVLRSTVMTLKNKK